MRILLMHPNYHSGGAEIAGHWPPAWAAYLAGALKRAGYADVHFVDAMTLDLDEATVRDRIAAIAPDLIGVTAITPSIYKAQRLLQIAQQVRPQALRVLGGVHATFMFQQVLAEAPWIDCIVRGEGEQILVEVVRASEAGQWHERRGAIRGIAYAEAGNIVATPAAPTVKDLDSIVADWSILDWSRYTYVPTGTRVAIPNLARGCPFTCSFCSQWKFWRDYRIRDPKKVVDEIEQLVREHDVGFFILADEEPTIHRKKFVQFCEELIARDLGVLWGINTRVTDILRDEVLLPLYRKAGLIHISLGTEAAAQLKLDRFNKETTIAQNKRAIELLRANGIVAEAQFIVGLENETRETLEETYRMALDWKPDMANWAMYTPWPFSGLYEELGDKVEIFDFEKYNFVTPIIKPDAMERGELLDRVMHNYRRFYLRKSLFEYPWHRDKAKRKYMLGCLKAFLKSGFERKFYDLGRVKYWGPQTAGKVDFGFDTRRTRGKAVTSDWKAAAESSTRMKKRAQRVIPIAQVAQASACGGGKDQLTEAQMDALDAAQTTAAALERAARPGGATAAE